MKNEYHVNKFLYKQMRKCYHAFEYELLPDGHNIGVSCFDCADIVAQNDLSLFTEQGFFILWKWCRRQTWWGDFKKFAGEYSMIEEWCLDETLVDFEEFPRVVYKFLLVKFHCVDRNLI